MVSKRILAFALACVSVCVCVCICVCICVCVCVAALAPRLRLNESLADCEFCFKYTRVDSYNLLITQVAPHSSRFKRISICILPNLSLHHPLRYSSFAKKDQPLANQSCQQGIGQVLMRAFLLQQEFQGQGLQQLGMMWTLASAADAGEDRGVWVRTCWSSSRNASRKSEERAGEDLENPNF